MSDLQFDSPVGTDIERASMRVWPGRWIDATGYAALYHNPATGRNEYHTGADLNLNYPVFDSDRGAEVHAAADGLIVSTGPYPVWGNILIMAHTLADGSTVWTRYAHLMDFTVVPMALVLRGTVIGHIGKPLTAGSAYHLHFDIAQGVNLSVRPSDWPGGDLDRVKRGYFDPRQFILDHHVPVQPVPVDVTPPRTQPLPGVTEGHA